MNMHIEPDPPRGSRFVFVTILISVLVHAGVSAGLSEMSGTPRKAVSYYVTFEPPPPPKPAPPPPPTPAPPKPKAPPPKPAEPKPEPVQKPVEPAKEVFGVSKDTVSDQGAFAVRVGNTLMKEQEKDFTDPSQVKQLAPVPEKKPVVKVSSPPTLRRSNPPRYPSEARATGREGRVVLRVEIDEHGRVKNLRVISEDPPDAGFGAAATAAVRDWVYDPPSTGSGVWFFQPVRFSLEN